MLFIGLIFLAFTVLFGLINLNAILKNKRAPRPSVFLHGAVAFFAILVLVGYTAATGANPYLLAALGLFLLAAMGGLYMLTMDLQKKLVPKAVALIHPLIGLSGIMCLILYLMQYFRR